MDATEIIKTLSITPAPTILIALGAVLILGSLFGGDFKIGGSSLTIGSSNRRLSGLLGLFFIALGLTVQINPIQKVQDYHNEVVSKAYAQGTTLIFQGNFKQAAASAVSMILQNPKYAPAWNQLAVAASQLTPHPDATLSLSSFPNTKEQGYKELISGMSILDINKALLLEPKYSSAWYNRGHILMSSRVRGGRWVSSAVWSVRSDEECGLARNQALDCFERALNINTNWEETDPADVWYYRGELILKSKNDFDRAVASYKKALEINPDHTDAQKALKAIIPAPQ